MVMEIDPLNMYGKNFECGCNINSVAISLGGVEGAGQNIQLRFCEHHCQDPVVVMLCGLLGIQPIQNGGE